MIEQPRARGSRTRSGLFSWVACLLAAFILTACAGPQFRYARHPDTNTYFRIPSDWALLEGDEVAMASAGTLSPQQEAQVRAATRWMVTFQSPAPSGDSEVPRIQGFARIRTIDDERIRENLSLNFLRNDLVPIDVLEERGEEIQVLREDDVVLENGVHGIGVVFNRSTEEGEFMTYNKIALVDSGTRTIWSFMVACTAECYVQNQGTIDEIVESWTVGGTPE